LGARPDRVARPRRTRRFLRGVLAIVVGFVLLVGVPSTRASPSELGPATTTNPSNSSAVQNFSAAIGRLVTLVGVAGSGLLALVWARVALSWFSHDITKKVQAKDRARDALIGTLLFVAALTGLVWGLAHWVLTGS
jgi:hypothetical protein